MPSFPSGVSPVDRGTFTSTYIDYRGEKANVSLTYPLTVTDVELGAMLTALSGVTNAGLVSFSNTEWTGISPANAETYDEAEASVSVKAELVFQDNGLNTRSVSVPAPDASFVGDDGFTIVNTGTMATLITEIANVLNGGAGGTGTFAFMRGYIVNRSRNAKKPNIKPGIVEPGVGDLPGDAPGV